ncbi:MULTISPECIES: hypothetical protein [Lactobacillus]|uniref:Uncharacterized protein n=1 Tax=Lactobacillus amylovorus TaxID=1604 RepID=A0A9X4ACU7_LACAM|nr:MULTISPECIES: hypothetical protein [Lactobacillus]MDB6262455.1 hypothetical protein [Lactobacillus amylovorus]
MGYPIIDDVVSLFQNPAFLTGLVFAFFARCYVVFPGFKQFIRSFFK